MKIEGLRNGKYYLKQNKCEFDSDEHDITMDLDSVLEVAYTLFDWAGSVLEVAYTLFDWAGLPYDAVEEAEDRLKNLVLERDYKKR